MNYINQEARIIAQIMAARKIGARLQLTPSRRVSYMLTPSTVSYRVELKPETPVNHVYRLQPDFLSHITRFRAEKGVADYDRTSVRVDMTEQVIEVNRTDPEMISFNSVEWNHLPSVALCGVAYHHGRSFPLAWRLDDSDQAHVLVAGTTGSGKTNELMSIMLSLGMYNPPELLRFSVIDMKRSRDLRVFDQLPHMLTVAREPAEALQLLRNYHAEMEQRERGRAPTDWRHVLVIDEAASLLAATDRAIRKEAMLLLEDIARKGRENSLNLVLCTQTPKANLLGDQLRNNLPLRLIGAVTTDDESDVAVGIARAGAEMLPGRGAMLYRYARTLKRFQAPLVETPMAEVRRILRKYGERPYEIATNATTSATTSTTMPATVIALSQAEMDAGAIRGAWQNGATQAEMIRILTGDPVCNTGGANRRRLLAAIAVLDAESTTTTTTTTATAEVAQKPRVERKIQPISFHGSSSSDLKPM